MKWYNVDVHVRTACCCFFFFGGGEEAGSLLYFLGVLFRGE